ncbi:hypothetical protein [uncultured Pantoea sp.]|uniref:hypothetical protein n=1 Tax=uncultured Pantoea sp. TaxID=218084 RepID=UPI0020580C17|nr:hypothetical protein [uncultured Pantoea sp.]DAL08703.1 MAG TPA_asm: hypothetical protein [Caudoviricetes sp.]
MTIDRVSSIIVKIIQKTVQGEMKWEVIEPPRYFEDGVEDIIPLLYVSSYKGKELAVFCRRFKYYTDEDEFHWEERNCFAFLNESKNKIIWEVNDRRPILNDLFSTVRESAAGINNMLENLFDD